MGGGASIINDDSISKASQQENSNNLTMKSNTKYYPNTSGPLLEFSHTIGFKEVYNDRGTGAKMDGSIWKPISPEHYYILGFFAKNDYQEPAPSICVADRLLGSPIGHIDALAVPLGFELVWNNKGSWFLEKGKNGRELAIYKPIAPPNYVSLGYVCVCSLTQIPKHTDCLFSTVRCVHESLVTYGLLDRLAWQSEGCSPDQEMSLWNASNLLPNENLLNSYTETIGAWIPVNTFHICNNLTRSIPVDTKYPTFLAEPPAHMLSPQDDKTINTSQVFNHVSGQWIEIRCFISSTFIDQHGERNILIKTVFPELNERLRRENRWVRLIPIDLRWGVLPKETSRIQQTCLNELDACISPLDAEISALSSLHKIPTKDVTKSVSTNQFGRPWVIALRGKRYGWVQDSYAPPEEFFKSERVRTWMKILKEKSVKLSITSMEVCHSILAFSSLIFNQENVQLRSSSSSSADMSESSLIHSFVYFRDENFM